MRLEHILVQKSSIVISKLQFLTSFLSYFSIKLITNKLKLHFLKKITNGTDIICSVVEQHEQCLGIRLSWIGSIKIHCSIPTEAAGLQKPSLTHAYQCLCSPDPAQVDCRFHMVQTPKHTHTHPPQLFIPHRCHSSAFILCHHTYCTNFLCKIQS